MANGDATTIQVSLGILEALRSRKLGSKESYDEVIRALLEDVSEISEQTKREIGKARAEAAAGRTIPLSKVKARLGIL